jgi:SAM-dependent methyltransferase
MRFDSNIDHVHERLKNYRAAQLNRTLSPKETMNDEWYFPVGEHAIEVIAAACVSARIRDVKNVLDLPCGHGRVLRHLVHFFPEAKLHACDVDRDGVDFCAKTFAAHPIHSREDLTKVDFGTLFDVIWVGSLFTHTSRKITRDWLTHLSQFLTDEGILIATFHGRWSRYVAELTPFIDEPAWNDIIVQYNTTGYGYRDYPTGHSHDYIQGSYGVSLAKPHTIVQEIEEIPGVRIHLYRERGWGDNQDVVVLGRPSHDFLWGTIPAGSAERIARRGQPPRQPWFKRLAARSRSRNARG